jgi:epoxide hydrolase-like predicted phosphatase
MIQAIIFDCFGVFYIDPFRRFIDAAKPEVRSELRRLMLQEDLGQVDTEQIIAAYSGLTRLPKTEVAQQLYGVHLVRNEALLTFVEGLHKTYKIGLLSNLSPGAMDKYFTQAERQKYFDTVVVSAEVGMIKPQPEIYQLTAERLEVAPADTLFIDDLAVNCVAARAVGMQTIVYEDLEQLKTALAAVLQK